jgi:hypothetical protein
MSGKGYPALRWGRVGGPGGSPVVRRRSIGPGPRVGGSAGSRLLGKGAWRLHLRGVERRRAGTIGLHQAWILVQESQHGQARGPHAWGRGTRSGQRGPTAHHPGVRPSRPHRLLGRISSHAEKCWRDSIGWLARSTGVADSGGPIRVVMSVSVTARCWPWSSLCGSLNALDRGPRCRLEALQPVGVGCRVAEFARLVLGDN